MRAQRQLSEAAQVAKICRQYLKSKGIKCRATSDNFSMGNSVNVTVYNQPPEVMKEIETELNQYQQGHFDGMTDMYEYSNSRNDIPQTKYLFIKNEYSDELKQKAWDFLRAKYPGNAEGKPENYSDAHRLNWCDSAPAYMDIAHEIYVLLNGSGHGLDKDNSIEFWDSLKVVQIRPTDNAPCHIEEHVHTKKGFTMYMVILDGSLERDVFNAYRDQAQQMGGWYSRKWGTTPGGFAFKERQQAENFADWIKGENPEPPKPNKSEKLRTIADKLQKQIDDKLADRLTNTPKRLAQAEHAKLEGYRLQRTQQALYGLADLWDQNDVPKCLQGINSKKEVYGLMAVKLSPVSNGYHGYHVETDEPRYDTDQAQALWSLLKPKSEEQKKKEELDRKLNDLQFSNIPGYFPTPEPVIKQMVDFADIKDADSILEPSAGRADIADYLVNLNPERPQINVCEVNHSLREILLAKGHKVIKHDFMDLIGGQFDKILMNPPFEKGQDIDHVYHAYSKLSNNGRLVAIMAASITFNSTRKYQDFRAFLDSKGAEVIELPPNSFKESGTGVNSVMVVLDK